MQCVLEDFERAGSDELAQALISLGVNVGSALKAAGEAYRFRGSDGRIPEHELSPETRRVLERAGEIVHYERIDRDFCYAIDDRAVLERVRKGRRQ